MTSRRALILLTFVAFTAAPLSAQRRTGAEDDLGARLYFNHCAACHGMETLSAGVLPDLRRSNILADAAAWQAVTRGGALASRGMVSFAERFSAPESEAIRAYVASESKRAAGGRQAHNAHP